MNNNISLDWQSSCQATVKITSSCNVVIVKLYLRNEVTMAYHLTYPVEAFAMKLKGLFE